MEAPYRLEENILLTETIKFYKRLIEKKQIALKSYIDNLVEADFDFSNKQKKKSSKAPSTEGEESDSGNEIDDEEDYESSGAEDDCESSDSEE